MLLEIKKLDKYYGENHALKEFTYSFKPGIYGLLGPNGAGKSTFMNILTCNLKKNSGEVLLDGKRMEELGKEYRRLLGYMPQQQKLYPDFTLNRFLHYMASLKGIKGKPAEQRIAQVIASVNLGDRENEKLGGFSGGMKQRALLAQAILGDPMILILDEPTAGLDPMERIRIRNLIASISMEKIVILATHVVSDIEMIADEVLFLSKGSIIESGKPEELCRNIYGKVFEKNISREKARDAFMDMNVTELKREYENVKLRYIDKKGKITPGANAVIPTLDDLYLYHFGR